MLESKTVVGPNWLVTIVRSNDPELPHNIRWIQVQGVLRWALQKGGRFRVNTSSKHVTERTIYTTIEAIKAGYVVKLELRDKNEILETHRSHEIDLLRALQKAASAFALPGYDSHPNNIERFGKKPPDVEPPDISWVPEETRTALKEVAVLQNREAWTQILELLGDPPEKGALYGPLFRPEISLSLWLSHLGWSEESESVLRRCLRSFQFEDEEVLLFALGEEQRRQGNCPAAGLSYVYCMKAARGKFLLHRSSRRNNDPYSNLFHWTLYRLGEMGRWHEDLV